MLGDLSQINHTPKVAILMATFNGERFLYEQLNSIGRQTYRNWELWVSDDGSSDNTLKIVTDFAEAMSSSNRVTLLQGPGKGATENFFYLLSCPQIIAAYFCFSDQDDIWRDEKLETAIAVASANHGKNKNGFLYCSRTELIDEHGKSIGKSPLFNRSPSFKNALVQSLAGGNTMLFCEKLKHIASAIPDEQKPNAHDWWLYQMATGVGADVYYDPNPQVAYRQHEKNQIGGRRGFLPRARSLKRLLAGTFKAWVDTNLKTLRMLKNFLTTENKTALEKFEHARNQGLFSRSLHCFRLGIYRQTTLGSVSLWVGIVLNKV